MDKSSFIFLPYVFDSAVLLYVENTQLVLCSSQVTQHGVQEGSTDLQ